MKKINIIYDSTMLIHVFSKGHDRSGVFFVVYNILKELGKDMRFKIYLYMPQELFHVVPSIKRDRLLQQFTFFTVPSVPPRQRADIHESHKKNAGDIVLFALRIIKNYWRLFCGIFCCFGYKDILKHTNIFFSPFHAIPDIIKKYSHIKTYMILYDTMPLNFPFYYPDINVNDINDWYGKILAGLNKETYYFCISECTKNDFLKYRHDQLDEAKMLVTYPAVSQQYIPLYDFQRLETILNKHNVKYNKGDIYIYSLCSIEPRKNLIFTINCFIKFIKKHHTENLYFYIGGGQWNNFIETFNNELCDLKNYRDKIIWLGYIDDEDMNILYSNSLFFTYISQYEGFGMPPLEAMRAGTPVITSNNSSLPEVVGGAAITITYNDEEACIKSFEDLYFNETLRKEYIEKGLERAKLFSWDKTVKLMTDTIMETIDN